MSSYVATYVRVFLLDDHDIVRRGVRDLLVAATDIDVVGDSASARDAARRIPELEVDVMVLDLRLQDGTGIEVCREVRSVNPSIRGLLLTSSGDDEALMAATLAGAAGYVVKLAGGSDIASAIRRVGSGRSLIDPATADRVARLLRTGMDELRPPLTEGERAMLTLVVDGLTNDQIADRLEMSLPRVSSDVTRLVERVMRPRSLGESPARQASPGRHRRPDA